MRLRRLLQTGTAATPPRDRLFADGMVVVAKGHYRLTLTVKQERQAVDVTRVFESDSCESLAGAAAVTLALLARGERASGASAASAPSSADAMPSASAGSTAPAASSPTSTSPPPKAATAPPPTPPPPLPPTPPPAKDAAEEGANRSTGRRWSPAFEAPVLAADQGMLPSWAYGVGLGAGLRTGGLRAMLKGLLWLPQSGGGANLYAGNFARRSGALSSCYGWSLEQFELGPCVTLTLEDVTASGTGPGVGGESGHASWLTVGAAARAAWSPWSRGSRARAASFFFRPGVVLTTSRPTFAIDRIGPVYQVPLVAAGLDIGCEWIL